MLKQDFTQATLEDHFDKTVLPKVMQVKDFGRAGRTKYTHLVDQDTTQVTYIVGQDTTQVTYIVGQDTTQVTYCRPGYYTGNIL